MDVPKLLLYIFSVGALITVTLPLFKKDHWIFRVFDYPRLQKCIWTGIAFAIWIICYRNTQLWIDWILIAALILSFCYLTFLILPFTPFGKKMIQKASASDDKEVLSVLVCNVYQYNRDFGRLLSLINKRNPDAILLLETNQQWLDGVSDLKKEYPHNIEVPLENTYGLLFYSRLPITHQQVNYLVDEETPSIIADLAFSDTTVRIYGVHPAPPVPQEAQYSTERDAELLIVGKEAKKHKGPCMVIGDLNDVAWSYTTKLFLKSSGLLDPRRGRGMYSTFHAKYLLLRWPLDHFFVSSHFHLVDMKVERNIGSDHFPISINLVLSDDFDATKFRPDAEDKELIEEKIQAGKNDEPR